MKEFELKYGCNPNQKPARVFMEDGSELPFEILSGRPGYINFLDAFNSWQLVKELKAALGMPAATSFKHVSPTSAAVGITMSDKLKKACFVDDIEGLDSIVCFDYDVIDPHILGIYRQLDSVAGCMLHTCGEIFVYPQK